MIVRKYRKIFKKTLLFSFIGKVHSRFICMQIETNRRQDKSQQNSRETKFTKVVFRSYMDSGFSTPEIRGEIDEHLGILGPVIKAEVGQSIMVRQSA